MSPHLSTHAVCLTGGVQAVLKHSKNIAVRTWARVACPSPPQPDFPGTARELWLLGVAKSWQYAGQPEESVLPRPLSQRARELASHRWFKASDGRGFELDQRVQVPK